MATVIESLIVTLGLDAKNFTRGTAESIKARKELEKNSKKLDDEAKKREKELEKDRKAQAKEAEKRAKEMGERIVKIRNQVLSLFAIFTAGVGIKNFIANTVESAVQLGYLSKNLDISIEKLQSYGRAAERSGGTTEGMFEQLKESANTIAQLNSGLGVNDSLQWFFNLGGSKEELKDANMYLMARSKIIAGIFKTDPTKAMLMAKQMGINENMFDPLKEGPEIFQKIADAQLKNSAITEKDSEEAKKLKNQWLDFAQAMETTGQKVLLALLPAFSQMMKWLQTLAEKITDNKDAIGKWVDKMVTAAIPLLEKFGNFLIGLDWDEFGKSLSAVGDAIVDIADGLKKIINLWNEWTGKDKVDTPGVTKLKGNISFGKTEDLTKDDIANGRTPRKKETWGNPVMKKMAEWLDSFERWVAPNSYKETPSSAPQGDVLSKLMKHGWSKEQAAGIAGSLQQESQLNPGATNPKSGAYGIGQWMGARRADFKAWAGKDIYGSSLDEQLAFHQYELTQGKERPAGAKLRAAKTAADAARIHSESYERPGASEAKIEQRQAYANQILSRIGAGSSAQRGNSSTSTSTSDVKIGTVNVQTQATDAKGIAASMAGALRGQFNFADQANTGFQ